jgi:signal transduction histidine kinase
VYWLRRIPAETRIVVLVVFLALIQSILLSVFGLRAIGGEQSTAERKLLVTATHYLDHYVVPRCEDDLRGRAEEVIRAAFDEGDPAWKEREGPPGGGLFTHAFAVSTSGRIEGPDGLPLWLPREVVEARAERAEARARELAGPGDWDAREKAEFDLAFAELYPFARDAFGESLALLFAATPLLSGEGRPDVRTLLRMRRVGVINRGAGQGSRAEVDRFLGRVDAAGKGNAFYAEGALEQDRHARVLAALVRERPGLSPSGPPGLHRNVLVPQEFAFYVYRLAGIGGLQVLSVDLDRLPAFLQAVVRNAGGTFEGIAPRIEEGSASSFEPDPARDIPVLPGYAAVARITPEAVAVQAGDRERFYWWIILCSVAGILAGGLLTARAVMREVKLAKMKSGFVSNITHELKTPLTSIRMFAEMLQSGKVTDSEERDECLAVITQETQRLTSLIQRVLDFGRLESQQRQFRWVAGPLGPTVEAEAARFRRATGLDESHFRVQVAVNLPPVTYDPEAMGEVVANLLSNAYKYAREEDRQIDLLLGPRHGRVVLSVEDNGPGVRPRERRRIFEQFYRASDLLTREVEGSGLGLAIARSIVRAHGGRIEVKDGSRGGSRFVVTLPAGVRGRPAPAEVPMETTP